MASITPDLLKEITEDHHLRHVTVEHDASKPHIEGAHVGTWDKKELLNSIEHGAALKHVESNDRSKPVIDPSVHVEPNHHKELMEEVVAAAGHTAVVREVKAVSSAAGGGPQGGPEYEGPTPPSAIAAQLRHVETVDKSKPVITPDVHVGKWDKAAFLAEVASPKALRHVDEGQVHDASRPTVEPGTHIGTTPMQAVLEQIEGGQLPNLHHIESK